MPLAIGAGGEFRTLPLSRHARTNIEVLRGFGITVTVEEEGRSCVVRVNTRSESCLGGPYNDRTD
ncbi:MAG: hypothetical protein IT186_06600 [Acidobacteria bacterium]|nr:hypothetical protein [Acidobacteriota bacterium]